MGKQRKNGKAAQTNSALTQNLELAEFYDRAHALPQDQVAAYEAAQSEHIHDWAGRPVHAIDPGKAGWLAAVTRPRPDVEILHVALPKRAGQMPPHTWHPVQRFTAQEIAGNKVWFARPVVFPETLPTLAALEAAHGSDRYSDYARANVTAEPVELEAGVVVAMSARSEIFACRYRGLWLHITRREYGERAQPPERPRGNFAPIAMV